MEQRRHLDGMVAEQQSARRQQYERELHSDHHHARRAALDAEAEAMQLQARAAGQQAEQRAMLDEQMLEVERRRCGQSSVGAENSSVSCDSRLHAFIVGPIGVTWTRAAVATPK